MLCGELHLEILSSGPEIPSLGRAAKLIPC